MTKISVTESIQYLAETDDAFGQMKGRMKGLEYRLKVCKAQEFLKSSASSAGVKEQEAYASDAYQALVKEYEDAVIDYETVAARRETRVLTIEVWRSQNANKRQGNI
jgi:hypothetical protein